MGQAGMKNNWKRNTRYMGVFAVLAAVFCMIVVRLFAPEANKKFCQLFQKLWVSKGQSPLPYSAECGIPCAYHFLCLCFVSQGRCPRTPTNFCVQKFDKKL
mgnify:CR=1 FL=1